MSNKIARRQLVNEPVTNVHRPQLDIGPATLGVFAQVLTQTDVSKAQILTLLEAKGLIGSGNYRLVLTGARLEPVDEPS